MQIDMNYHSVLALFAALVAGGAASAPEPLTREYYVDGAARIVTGHDRNGDGKLSREEWVAMATAGPTHDAGGMSALAKSIFDLYDLNGDNLIAAEELATQYLYSFDCLDLDHDGRLSRDEARHGIEGRCDPQNPPPTR